MAGSRSHGLALAPAAAREALEGSCASCGAPIAEHYARRRDGDAEVWIGHPRPARPGLGARLLQRLARASTIADALTRVVDRCTLAQLPLPVRERRCLDAARLLAAVDPAALAVARHRGRQQAEARFRALLRADAPLSARDREICRLIAEGYQELYEASLEGQLGEVPETDDEPPGAGPAHCDRCGHAWREHTLEGCRLPAC